MVTSSLSKTELLAMATRWFGGKDFTTDWLSPRKIAPLLEVLRPLQDCQSEVLEVGSWEGRSAIFFMEYLPCCRITCVDTFGGSANHLTDPKLAPSLPGLEERFDRNTAAYPTRLGKIKARSAVALDRLAQQSRLFDVIYIDASHRRDDVLADSILAWRLLKIEGVMIWDDLKFMPDWPSSERAEEAINLFATVFASCLTELHRGAQLVARKTGEWPMRRG